MKRCLKCGTSKNITRDHVVSRVLLKRNLDRDQYARFSAAARDINIQPLCRECNNEKGGAAIDYRTTEERVSLLLLLDKWNLDIEVKSGQAHGSIKQVIRYCQIHDYGGHRTDDCLLFKNIPKLVENITQFVEERNLIDSIIKANSETDS